MGGVAQQRKVTNQAGNVKGMPVPHLPLRKKCVNPFRELSVTYDGKVHLCCADYGREYICGDIHAESLQAIWEGDAFRAARFALFHRLRRFSPCSRCDYFGGNRQGLLPAMPFPGVVERDIIRAVVGRRGLDTTMEPQYLFGGALK
jgi:radical SAM protein with 4Fe4S-binding SPASM domain